MAALCYSLINVDLVGIIPLRNKNYPEPKPRIAEIILKLLIL
jgi:hypothetical protein